MPKLLKLIVEPNKLLHQKSTTVEIVDDSVRALMDDMLYTLRYYKGFGLAAVQIGVLKKVIVIDIPSEQPIYMVNAKIIESSDEKFTFNEGCLSIPNFFADVTRASKLTVEYLDYDGYPRTIEAAGNVLSVCMQHEIDHTNGVVFIDYLSPLKRDIARKKVQKFIESQK